MNGKEIEQYQVKLNKMINTVSGPKMKKVYPIVTIIN